MENKELDEPENTVKLWGARIYSLEVLSNTGPRVVPAFRV